jgi:hypothetical protein
MTEFEILTAVAKSGFVSQAADSDFKEILRQIMSLDERGLFADVDYKSSYESGRGETAMVAVFGLSDAGRARLKELTT